MTTPRRAILDLDLKVQDGTLLALSILDEAEHAGNELRVIRLALQVAAYGHREQTRSVRLELPIVPYVEHPYRNTLRLYRYGVTDQTTIVGALLHDVVEDAADTIATVFAGATDPTNDEARDIALAWITDQFGADVASVVHGMTNPFEPEGLTTEESVAFYVAHAIEATNADARVALDKFTDWQDNAGSLRHQITDDSDPADLAKAVRRAGKYLPLAAHWETRLAADDVRALVSAQGTREIMEHLRDTRTSLERIVATHPA